MSTVAIKNQAADELILTGVTAVDAKIPASGQADLSSYNKLSEIKEDEELRDLIDAGKGVLIIDGIELSKGESQAWMMGRLGTEVQFPTNHIVTSSTYQMVSRLKWEGFSARGLPYNMSVFAYVLAGSGSIRVIDITNKQTIAELTDIINTSEQEMDLGVISNITAGPAAWEIQIKVSVENDTIGLTNFTMRFK